MSRLCALLCVALCFLCCWHDAEGLSSVTTATVLRQGLRSQGAQGSFKAAAYLPDGNLILLCDQADGVRLVKTGPSADTILAQARQGAAGDAGVALALDPSGNIYIAGTSSSGQLTGTTGAAFAAPVDSSLNSFVAKFDPNLNLVFLTFLGAGRTEVTGIAATADAVFLTGATYGGSIPTTAGAFQRTPPNASNGSGNGFVERFRTDGSALAYATYLNGLEGGSVPSSIAASAQDIAYVGGATSSPSFPVANALQPILAGATGGFLTAFSPDGTAIAFSTFLAGSGISSLALDAPGQSLLLTGEIASGQFPLATASAPMAATAYQSLLRLSLDGQSVLHSILLAPSTASSVTPGPDGTAWVTGTLTVPLSPALLDTGPGDSYAMHLTSDDQVDQVLRLGGSATGYPSYAHLTTVLAAASLSPDHQVLTLPGTVAAQTDPSLRSSTTFDLGLTSPSNFLASTVQDLLPATCMAGAGCSGSGGLLTQISLAAAQPVLVLSTGDLPSLTLRNVSSSTASGISASATGFSVTGNCPGSLTPHAQCGLLLTGSGPGTLSIAASNASPVSAAVPSSTATPVQTLAFDRAEVDFGIVTAQGSPSKRTVTITNLGTEVQSFASAPENLPSASPYILAESASTCPGTAVAHSLAPQSTCTVELSLTASSLPEEDTRVAASWKFGARDIVVTGITQAASLSLSATEIDFGAGGAPLPRYLYLSNASSLSIAHAALLFPPDFPFQLLDGCPDTLLPGSICRITITYTQTSPSALDSTTLTLDQGLSVLLMGQTAAAAATPPATATSPLQVLPRAVSFAAPVTATQLSTETQTVQVTNTGQTTVPLSLAVAGDFLADAQCPSSLGPQQTCTVSLRFSPTQAGLRDGVLTVRSASGDEALSVPLTGTATPLLPSRNGTLDLGQTVVGEPLTAWYPLQGSFAQVTAGVGGAGFAVALLAPDGNGHGTLPDSAFSTTTTAACTGCWLAVRYHPQAAGTARGTLQLATDTAGQPSRLDVEALATPALGLVLTPGTLNFGAVAQGTASTSLTAVLFNLDPRIRTATLQQVSVTGDFALTAPPPATNCGKNLSPGASCSLAVTFSPTAAGLRTGLLTVTTDSGTATAELNGVGISITAQPPTAPSTSTLDIFPDVIDFGPQALYTLSSGRQVTLRNVSSQVQAVTFAASRNFPFAQIPSCASLNPGDACTFTVVFIPQQSGPLAGTVTLTSTPQDGSAASQTTLYLRGYSSGSGSLLASAGAEPDHPLAFGTVSAGGSVPQTVTLTNTDSTPHTLRRLTTTAPFTVADTCPQVLDADASCVLQLAYSGTSPAASSSAQAPHPDAGTLLIEDDAGTDPLTLYLSGTVQTTASQGAGVGAPLPTYTLSQTSLTFANTPSGSSAPAQSITVSNTGTVPVLFGSPLLPAPFQATSNCGALAAGATCTVNVTFTPTQSARQASAAVLELPSNAGTALDFVTLLGSAFDTPLRFDLTSYDFAGVPVGSTAQVAVSLTNGADLPVSLGSLGITGPFTVQMGDCPAVGSTLAAGQTCTLIVVFTPSSAGPQTGTLTLTSPGTSPQTVTFTGSVLGGALTVQPAALDFGNVVLNQQGTATLAVTNTGTGALTSLASVLSGADAAAFAFASDCPATLPAGAACSIQVTFTSSSLGAQNATLALSSTDPHSPLLIPLTATGVQPPGFTFTVQGTTSASSTLQEGATAVFPLLVTPQGGYTGTVSITCTPVLPAPNTVCTALPAQVTLAGAAVPVAVSLATQSGILSAASWPLGLLLGLPCALTVRRRMRPAAGRLAVLFGLFAALGLSGCARGPGFTGAPYTPSGTYRYQVTAASTVAPLITHIVTLTIDVQ